MIRIVDSTNRRAVERAALARADARCRHRAARRRRSSPPCAATATAALVRYARDLDRPQRPDRGLARRDAPRGARRCRRRCARQFAPRRGTSARSPQRQVPRGWRARVAPGVTVEQRVVPLDRVGCYVPAGRYPLPSSLLMTAIPADAAGVGEVVAVCPRPAPVVMAAALEAGVSRLFRVGGAHAVAALAYGTRDDSARGQDRRARATATWLRPRRWWPPTAASTSTPARRKS